MSRCLMISKPSRDGRGSVLRQQRIGGHASRVDRFTLERVVSVGVLAALDLGLWRVLAPARRQLVAALVAAFVVGLADVAVELVAGTTVVYRIVRGRLEHRSGAQGDTRL